MCFPDRESFVEKGGRGKKRGHLRYDSKKRWSRSDRTARSRAAQRCRLRRKRYLEGPGVGIGIGRPAFPSVYYPRLFRLRLQWAIVWCWTSRRSYDRDSRGV